MSGPCRVRVRVRVVEFSSSPTTCADFVRVGSGPCRVRVVEFSSKSWRGRVTVACSCNGLSDRCYFDEEMYSLTGHGGHCTDCRQDTDGAHCQRCRDQFYRPTDDDRCQQCACNSVGKSTPRLMHGRIQTNLGLMLSLQCFDAVGWAAGRASGL